MNRYFCLCPGGIKSDKDADVRVESFREIQEIINNFGDAIPNKFSKLRTKHILNESPVKFPYWGKVYMVLGTTKDGHEVPLGYCNFAKEWHNSFSTYSALLYFIFALSISMAIYNILTSQEKENDELLECMLDHAKKDKDKWEELREKLNSIKTEEIRDLTSILCFEYN